MKMEQLVLSSPLKFIGELNPEAKLLLEGALMELIGSEKNILKGTTLSLPSSPSYDSSVDDNISEASDDNLCSICFDQVCTIEVQDCGHQMCAHCTLSLCCYNKPNPTTTSMPAPLSAFCRSTIAQLGVAKSKINDKELDTDINVQSQGNQGYPKASVKTLSALGSFGKMGGMWFWQNCRRYR